MLYMVTFTINIPQMLAYNAIHGSYGYIIYIYNTIHMFQARKWWIFRAKKSGRGRARTIFECGLLDSVNYWTTMSGAPVWAIMGPWGIPWKYGKIWKNMEKYQKLLASWPMKVNQLFGWCWWNSNCWNGYHWHWVLSNVGYHWFSSRLGGWFLILLRWIIGFRRRSRNSLNAFCLRVRYPDKNPWCSLVRLATKWTGRARSHGSWNFNWLVIWNHGILWISIYWGILYNPNWLSYVSEG